MPFNSQKNNIDIMAQHLYDGVGASGIGDPVTTTPVPTVSLNSVYNLIPANGRTYTAGAGSVTAVDRHFLCGCGTTIFGYGTLQSFRAINHRAGYGACIRFGAVFPDAVALTWIGVGGFTVGDEVSFGRNGTSFGVWHRYGGRPEVQTLTVTGAAGGSENATVTIDGTGYTVPLTAGTVQQNAQEIAAYLDDNATGWDAEQIDDTVVISAQSDGDKTGAFTFSSSTAVAGFTETTAGVTKTSNFVAQADFNGTVPAGFDPTKGNNFQIRFANGFGAIKYYIEDNRGEFVLAHTVRWPSSGTSENFDNPSLHIGAYSASIGSTTNATVQCSWIIGSIEGPVKKTRNPRSQDNTKSIGTTLTNVLTLRNLRNYNGVTNQSEVEPLFVTLANDGTKSAIFEIRGNPTISGTQNFQESGNNLITVYDTAGTTVSGGRLLASFTVAKGQSEAVDLSRFGIAIPPTLSFCIAGKMASGSSADLSASLTWYEDI